MTEIEQEAERLKMKWIKAAGVADLDPIDDNIDAEQAAWDAVVDYVEANDLNYTKYDPRGLA